MLKFSQVLQPHQMGLGIKDSCHMLVMAVKLLLDADDESETVCVKMDFKNAYGSVKREAIRASLEKHDQVKFLLPWFDAMYGGPNIHTVHGDDGEVRTISQIDGIMQGDPLGVLWFSLAIKDAMESTRASYPSVFIRAYIDDPVLVGKDPDVYCAYNMFVQEAEKVGLIPNQDKQMILTHGDFGKLEELEAKIKVNEHGLGTMKDRVDERGTLLGVALGTEGDIREAVLAAANELVAHLHLVNQLADAQAQVLLLRYCFSTCLNHWAKVTKPSLMKEAWTVFGSEIEKPIEKMT